MKKFRFGMVSAALALAVMSLGLVVSVPQLSSSVAGAAGTSLVIGSQVAPPSLDPTSNASAAIDEVFDYNVYQHLVELDPKGGVIPVLATGYAVSSDGLTYTFTLRSGVTFSNGDPLTAADVVYSLNRAANPKSGYPYQDLVADISSVTSPNSDTVVVTLSQRDAQFIYNLAAYSNGVVLDPSAVANIATQPVGTGPYVFQSEVNNYDIVLGANPKYWGGTPDLSTVTFRYFASSSTLDSALKSGEIQAIDNLASAQDVSQFKGNSAYQVITGPTEGKIDLTINDSYGPLKKLKVRQAIAYATNKKAILKIDGDGYGTVIGSDQVPGDPWYTPSINKTYAYNPTKAKKLLREAGYKHGFSLTLTIPPYGYAETAGPLIQAELQAVGIKVTLKNIAWALWISKVFEADSYQLTIIDQVEARDISEYGDCSYYWKYSACSQVSKMLTIAAEAPTTAASTAEFRAIVKKINEAAVVDWLYNPDQLTVAASDVVGLPSGSEAESFNLSYASIGGELSATAKSEGFVK
jgi:peptide/nickel transport system substrate-binding protein